MPDSPTDQDATSRTDGDVGPYRYRVAGLVVASDLEVLEFVPDDRAGGDDVRLLDGRRRQLPCREGGSARSMDGQRVFVDRPGMVATLVEEGRRVTVWPAAAAHSADVSLHIANTAMAIVLVQRGHTVLHGAVVAIDGRGVALAGWSGQGKSTLAAACWHAGHDVLSDDLAPIVTARDGFLVRATSRVLRTALDADAPIECARAWQADGKSAYRLACRSGAAAVPLSLVAVIEDGPDVAIAPVGGAAAVPMMMNHVFCQPALAPGGLTAHFDSVACLVRAGLVCRLVRPRDLSRLPQVVEALQRALGHGRWAIGALGHR